MLIPYFYECADALPEADYALAQAPALLQTSLLAQRG